MKTNQVLTRTMGEFSVLQRTSDRMFNATELLKQWNASSGQKKVIAHYFENDATVEFIETIVSKEFSDIRKSDVVNSQTIRNVYVKRRGGIGGGGSTWMHPLLFIDFAMWINPSFKYDVLKFVYDQLIEYRNQAGNSYRRMCERIAQVSKKGDIPKNISSIAKAINIVVYGVHEKQMRNKQAEESSMRELVKLQEMIIELIDNGYIKTYEGIRQYLLNTWRKKNQPKELTA